MELSDDDEAASPAKKRKTGSQPDGDDILF